jgi:hypothetical protein
MLVPVRWILFICALFAEMGSIVDTFKNISVPFCHISGEDSKMEKILSIQLGAGPIFVPSAS